jgi:hypothetical protein
VADDDLAARMRLAFEVAAASQETAARLRAETAKRIGESHRLRRQARANVDAARASSIQRARDRLPRIVRGS